MTSQILRSTTFTIGESDTMGVFQDGVAWVNASGGSVTLTGMTPVADNVDGYAVNGAMLNPAAPIVTQGFDGRCAALLTSVYSAGDDVASSLPLTLNVGDTVWKSVHHDLGPAASIDGSTARSGLFDEMNVLMVIDWTPGPLDVSPICAHWAGKTGHTRIRLTDTLANLAASLPSFDLSGVDINPVADIIAWFDVFDPAYGITIGTSTANDQGYQQLMLNKTNAGWGNNYGRHIAGLYHAALWHLIGNVATQAEKETLLLRAISQGVQTAFPHLSAGTAFGGNGAHHQFHQCLGLWAMLFTDTGFAYADFLGAAQGNLFAQVFEFDAAYIADNLIFHTDAAKPASYHEHLVTGVGGLDITTDQPRGPLQTAGCLLTRKSDGAQAVINGSTGFGAGAMIHPIDAQPVPAFAPGDVVHFRYGLAHGPRPGDVDWDIRVAQGIDNPDNYEASAEADYRSLQEQTGIAPCIAVGAWDVGMNHVMRYVEGAFAPGFPAAHNDWPKPAYGFGGHGFNQTAWETLWPAIKAQHAIAPPAPGGGAFNVAVSMG